MMQAERNEYSKKNPFFDKFRGQVEKESKSLCDPTESGRATTGSVDLLFDLTTDHGICQRTKESGI
jgi:hypothetical protein